MCRYFGLSSTGITYKSSAASFGSGSFSSGSFYGSTVSSFRDNYRGKEWDNISKETVSGYSSSKQISKECSSGSTSYMSSKREGHGNRYPLHHLNAAALVIFSCYLLMEQWLMIITFK
jgi:epsin